MRLAFAVCNRARAVLLGPERARLAEKRDGTAKGEGGEKQSVMEDAVAIRIGRDDFKKG